MVDWFFSWGVMLPTDAYRRFIGDDVGKEFITYQPTSIME